MSRELTTHKITPVSKALTITVLDERGPGGANHAYQITGMNYGSNSGLDNIDDEFDGDRLIVLFQRGPMQENNAQGTPNGVNGITEQALLAMLIDRYAGFQSGPYACQENAETLHHLHCAMEAMNKRFLDREARGVQGTYQK